eukprot:symbB.v1.2.025673.t1/scaffold2507.1/size77444/7
MRAETGTLSPGLSMMNPVVPTTFGSQQTGLRSRRRNSSMCSEGNAGSDDSVEERSRNAPPKKHVVIRMDARDPARVPLPKRITRREEQIQIWYIFDRFLAFVAALWHLRFCIYGRPARWAAWLVYEVKVWGFLVQAYALKELILMSYDVLVASRPVPEMQNRIKRTMALSLKVMSHGTRLLTCARCRRKPRLLANPFD